MSSGSTSSHRKTGNNMYNGVKINREMPKYCDCGYMVGVQTSWTDANPGQRFVACPQRGVNGCRFFNWCDPEMCDRSKQIIPGLLKRINYLEAQIPLEVSVLVKKISDLESQLQQKSDGNGEIRVTNTSARLVFWAASVPVVVFVFYFLVLL